MLSLAPASEPRDVERRTYLDVALFWGSHWPELTKTAAGRERLRSAREAQKGRYYPPVRGRDALMVLESAYAASMPTRPDRVPTRWRRIGPDGLRILERHLRRTPEVDQRDP